MTSRENPHIEWFFDSLHTQCKGDYSAFNVLVVDFHAEKEGRVAEFAAKFRGPPEKLRHVTPKPTVWQGKHRLTSKDYFAAANARNTAICLAPDGYICFVDDLSVVMPGWFQSVLEATTRDAVTLGVYKKVKELQVESGTGVVTHFVEHSAGNDHRIALVRGNPPQPCLAQWHFGCSLVAPVEHYLRMGGFAEGCDGMGYEDAVTGSAMARNGTKFLIDTRMMTWESEEGHTAGTPMARLDKGKTPRDKSHAMIAMYQNARHFDNYFGSEGIRGVRARVLAGEPFPITQCPEHDWYDSQPLREM